MNLDDKYFFDLRQEKLYWEHTFLDKKWFKKLFGGKWYFVKLDKNTPDIYLYTVWTKRPDFFSGYKKILEKEKYKETFVDNQYKLMKEFILQIILRK